MTWGLVFFFGQPLKFLEQGGGGGDQNKGLFLKEQSGFWFCVSFFFFSYNVQPKGPVQS